MINLPYYWKEELDRIADRLDRRQNQRRWTQRSEASLEKDVFLGLFAVRKLVHSRKVPARFGPGSVGLTRYPARKDASALETSTYFLRRFDVRRDLKPLCAHWIWQTCLFTATFLHERLASGAMLGFFSLLIGGRMNVFLRSNLRCFQMFSGEPEAGPLLNNSTICVRRSFFRRQPLRRTS